VVYHDPGSDCAGGLLASAGDIPQMTDEDLRDLAPCPDCRPRNWRQLGEGGQVRLEIPLYSYEACPLAADLIRPLLRPIRCKSCHDKPHLGRTCKCGCERYVESDPSLSMPGQRLLTKAALTDPDIAAVLAKKTVL
jgi:hypothetical protein